MPRDKQRQVAVDHVRGRAQDNSPIDRHMAEAAWPVGSIFVAITPTNPALLLGFGVWESFAEGRVLVGLDPLQAEFDTVLETGGEKTHILTCAEVPSC